MFHLALAAVGAIWAAAVVLAERSWRRAVRAQMAAEIWTSATWRVDQRATALIQRMKPWSYLPPVASLIRLEAARAVADEHSSIGP